MPSIKRKYALFQAVFEEAGDTDAGIAKRHQAVTSIADSFAQASQALADEKAAFERAKSEDKIISTLKTLNQRLVDVTTKLQGDADAERQRGEEARSVQKALHDLRTHLGRSQGSSNSNGVLRELERTLEARFRSQAQTTETVMDDLAALKDAVSEQLEAVTSARADLSAMGVQCLRPLEAIKADIAGLADLMSTSIDLKLADLGPSIQSLSHKVTDYTQFVSNCLVDVETTASAKVDGVSSQVADLKAEVLSKVEATGERLLLAIRPDGLQTREEADSSASALDTRIGELTSTVEEGIDSLGDASSDAAQALGSVDDKLKLLAASTTPLEGQLEEIRLTLSKSNASISTLNTAKVSRQVSALDAQVKSLASRLDRIDASVSSKLPMLVQDSAQPIVEKLEDMDTYLATRIESLESTLRDCVGPDSALVDHIGELLEDFLERQQSAQGPPIEAAVDELKQSFDDALTGISTLVTSHLDFCKKRQDSVTKLLQQQHERSAHSLKDVVEEQVASCMATATPQSRGDELAETIRAQIADSFQGEMAQFMQGSYALRAEHVARLRIENQTLINDERSARQQAERAEAAREEAEHKVRHLRAELDKAPARPAPASSWDDF